jgi:signal transduction histidine kinase
LVDLVIEVQDKGIGMASNDQATLFNPYYETSDSKSKHMNRESHGLGLSICKEIATKLNASLEFSSELNVGSSFVFNV